MKFIFATLIFFIGIFSVFPIVYAQGAGTNQTGAGVMIPGAGEMQPGAGEMQPGAGLMNPLQVSSIAELIQKLLEFVVKIGTILLTFMLIYVGFQFVIARGNEEKISTARTSLMWTIIGGLILLGAQVIASAIAATVNAL